VNEVEDHALCVIKIWKMAIVAYLRDRGKAQKNSVRIAEKFHTNM
jgi:uncharacterized membrane protein YsdA (DUF1294 family)